MHAAVLLLELGGVLLGLGLLGRLAGRIGLSPIPLYLLAGLAFGKGGLLPLVTAQEFIQVGAEIGIILLLLLLGLEYSVRELLGTLRAAAPAGAGDLLLNFPPGLAAGLLLGWGPLAAVVLGGVTYISSSGVAAKVLGDLGRHGNRETPVVLSILVLEDLAMAVYLPVVTVLLAGGTLASSLLPATLAVAAVAAVLAATLRYGSTLSRLVFSPNDEVLLLKLLGVAFMVAGAAQAAQVSAAVGAFLVGIALSGPAARGARALLLDLPLPLALLAGAILASTDPVLLRDVLRNRRIPRSVRQALSVEASTNDIIVLPILPVVAVVASLGVEVPGPSCRGGRRSATNKGEGVCWSVGSGQEAAVLLNVEQSCLEVVAAA
jgi:monovalent cation:H+ antiporter-2, CPA2 family